MCHYFIFGKSWKQSWCLWEHDNACESGTKATSYYDIYKREAVTFVGYCKYVKDGKDKSDWVSGFLAADVEACKKECLACKSSDDGTTKDCTAYAWADSVLAGPVAATNCHCYSGGPYNKGWGEEKKGPTPTCYIIDKVVPYSLVKSNVECKPAYKREGKLSSAQECANAVKVSGGDFFIFGKGSKLGNCYKENTASESCAEGWVSNEYDFFKIEAPTQTLMLAHEGKSAQALVSKTYTVKRGATYVVQKFEVLRNDLGGASEKVTSIKVNGVELGECNPDGGDYDCTYFDCQKTHTFSTTSTQLTVQMTLTGHSWDCDCDTTTWECSKEDTWEGRTPRTPVTSVARITLAEAR